MHKPEKPANEAARLAALQALRLLDTPPEQRFNRITRTAARIFRVPIALVSLVDAERQWFKSRFGLLASETPRDISFCGHAILGETALVVEDALLDPRFADNPLVTGSPRVRFYAGHPLAGPGGVKLGTLCLIDHQPRSFDAHDRLTLADMAGWVEREINLDNEQHAAQVRLNSVLEAVGEAVLVAAEDGSVETANAAAARYFGYDAHEMVGAPLEQFLSCDGGTLRRLSQASAWNPGASLQCEARLKTGSASTLRVAVSDFFVLGRRMYTLCLRQAHSREDA